MPHYVPIHEIGHFVFFSDNPVPHRGATSEFGYADIAVVRQLGCSTKCRVCDVGFGPNGDVKYRLSGIDGWVPETWLEMGVRPPPDWPAGVLQIDLVGTDNRYVAVRDSTGHECLQLRIGRFPEICDGIICAYYCWDIELAWRFEYRREYGNDPEYIWHHECGDVELSFVEHRSDGCIDLVLPDDKRFVFLDAKIVSASDLSGKEIWVRKWPNGLFDIMASRSSTTKKWIGIVAAGVQLPTNIAPRVF